MQRPLHGDEFQFQCGWNIVAEVELVGRGQIMQGLEGHTRHLDFTLSVMLAHRRVLSRGSTHLMFLNDGC